MTAVAAGSFVVGVLVGLAVGDVTHRHLRKVNRTLVADLQRERALRQQWVKVAEQRIAERLDDIPDQRDWVPRSDMVRLAHRCEQAEAEVARMKEQL